MNYEKVLNFKITFTVVPSMVLPHEYDVFF